MKNIFIRLATSAFLIGVAFFISVMPVPAFAGGTLELKCDANLIHKSLKNIYPACARNGFALPGDVVLLEGFRVRELAARRSASDRAVPQIELDRSLADLSGWTSRRNSHQRLSSAYRW